MNHQSQNLSLSQPNVFSASLDGNFQIYYNILAIRLINKEQNNIIPIDFQILRLSGTSKIFHVIDVIGFMIRWKRHCIQEFTILDNYIYI
ncbi:unnamed protein product [Paramecium octaurelia]|uniref:Uncharacterized protein n=1 Tax=Paramecium octaurelia TaxID=43137 RepID=A0A8S1WML2_PAROT|nr:unnamed protein product [Paramecium octaurelia]